ncbi:helix-turn-helix domain-containing protein [Ralstonia pickettii]|uniref:helix-turn-helix domain-containing protein n=1 Tax=Ralstonia pickettii TaxID=329 RepID=UPI00046A2D1B|nr:helix-turn-helix domain-containing protein [Ralstonia pickettii]
MTTKNAKGRAPGKDSAALKTTARNDNSAQAQRQKVLALLRVAGRNTFEFRAHGIAMPATRIFELKAQGFDIRSSRIVAVDSDGHVHAGVAFYELIVEAE